MRKILFLALSAAILPPAWAEETAGPAPGLGEGKAVSVEARVEPKEVAGAVEKGGRFLLGAQGKDGGWAVKDGAVGVADNEYIRAAVTAIVIDSLGAAKVGGAAEAVTRGRRFIDENGRRRAAEVTTGFPGNTQRLYAAALGLSDAARRPAGKERDGLVKGYLESLEEMRKQEKGLAYYGNGTMSTFQASLLAAGLQDVKDAGYELPKDLLKETLDGIESSRSKENGGFGYRVGQKPTDEQDAACRSVACEAVLAQDGRADAKAAETAIARLFKNRKLVDEVQTAKNQEHHDTGRHNIAKYYNLFSLRWAAKLLPRLPDDKAEAYAHAIGRAVVDFQRADGSWLDSTDYAGPAYGTSYALLTLSDVARALAAVKERKAGR